MTDSSIVADLADATPEQIAEILAILSGMDEQEPVAEPTTQEPKAVRSERREDGKVKCKCCGFWKKPRKVLVETGLCGVCTTALSEPDGQPILDGGEIEVVGRMGKRGRNTVSIVDPRSGKRWKVKRLSNRHSERVAAKHRSKGKGFAKKPSHGSTPPKGLPTSSRLPGDPRI